jgi:hypothetical protein
MRAIKSLAWGLAAAFAGPLLAAPLEKEVCNSLREEHDQLVLAGAKADMERGPEWARANLAFNRIKQIERLIAVGEQLAFRCPQPNPSLERAEDVEPAAAAASAPAASESHKRTGSAKAVRAPRKDKTLSAARAAGQAERRRSKRSPPRPQANDAYVPPQQPQEPYSPPTASSLPRSGPPAH